MIFEFQDSKDDSRGFSFLNSIVSFSLLERETGDAMANWTWNFISPRMRGCLVAGRKESFPEECNILAGQEDKECHPHAKLDTQMKFNMATRKSSLVAPSAEPIAPIPRTKRELHVPSVVCDWRHMDCIQRFYETDSTERILYGNRDIPWIAISPFPA